jgi:predicted DNA-binding protein
MKIGNQVKITSYYSISQITALDKLSEKTRVPKAEYLREALEELLKKYASSVRDAPRRLKRSRKYVRGD